MCGFSGPSAAAVTPQVFETPRSDAARRRGETEAALRRRLAGVGSDMVTGPMGIPSNTRMGVAA